jgi:hypothetical protein
MYAITPNYLKNHYNVTEQMRAGFVKFYFKVAQKFHLKRTTVFSAVYYMDAFLEKNPELEKE